MIRTVLAVLVAALIGGSSSAFAQGGQLTPQDLVEIQQLYAKYNWALDAGESQAYAATFTPDGIFNTTNVGKDALVKFADTFHAGLGSHVRHWNTNLLITPTATGAAGQVYLILVDFATKPASIVTSAAYTDELVKTAQGWRFKKRQTKGDVAPAAATKQ